MSSYLEAFSKWLKLKIYQLEVTLSVYIFTPIEKFIFYSVLFLIVSLTFIATVLYLPQHVQFVLSRAWFYMNGDAPQESAAAAAAAAVQHIVAKSAAVVTDTVQAVAAATGGIVREL
ncbi:hypothetical protein B0T26DRAFT_636262 [Lasiosphaeria miniovina]|uniref:Uncharacterized protein n=1 Tax=Lasiosphaeria miniovina TaxID=1954250 RepID=A0AA40B3Y8_9PEZI|nr:uncharacterized protein B0T26DRAFT_636262 [Lasiosphaeria miniovina]KAK0727255.1 hypothetical protein B0T26DRAFT_636262 [Lasiosphaeria miniovina]